ncbi:sphingomyelin phosphodiesterase-like isoform X2 [Bacillus rossius redtenbacheri]|uniref:sphingomyelin phosphodiesterase-like isoform X2 n=1 Tax=Bacillus rossius redtenbacheri TaxID=93214 RepID=UPI002FDE4D39
MRGQSAPRIIRPRIIGSLLYSQIYVSGLVTVMSDVNSLTVCFYFTAPSSAPQSDVRGPEPARCTACRDTVKRMYGVYNANRSRAELRDAVVSLCVSSRLYDSVVCPATVDVFLEMMVYFAEHAGIDAVTNRLCTLILNRETCSADVEWTVDADMGVKPDVVMPTISHNVKPVACSQTGPVTIVHVSDLHLDPKYSPGNEAPCSRPLCCREPAPGGRPGGAGPWGDYRRCDLPLRTVRSMLQGIRRRHPRIDYIYYTGDFVNHAVWDYNRQHNSDIITKVVEVFNETFGDIPVFFTLGNSEPAQKNGYAPLNVSDAVSTRYLFELVSELWSPYVTPEAQQTLLRGGFYTVVPRPGFRVIVLNSVVCLNSNYWLAYDPIDPYSQLQWLVGVLREAERAGERVHILYHVPSGLRSRYGWCLKVWGREFHKIVDRFENIVTAHFAGHTHYEEFHVFYSTDNSSRANGVSFVSGSASPFIDVNPSYKVYTVDPASWHVADAVAWSFNLTEANLRPEREPAWRELYSMREEYGLRDLLPARLDSLVHRMAANHDLLQRNYVKQGDPQLVEGCDDLCLKAKLCEIVTVESGNLDKCDELGREFDAANMTHRASV